MTDAFSVTIRRAKESGAAHLELIADHGTSRATSDDGTTTAIVLGTSGETGAATRLANAGLGSRVDSAPAEVPGAGILLIDHTRHECVAVMPHIGIRTVFWHSTNDQISVASSPDRLASAASLSIDSAALYDYVYFHVLPAPRSIFRGISKLCGGHRLTWSGERVEVKRYWRPVFTSEAEQSDSAAIEELRSLLRAAVDRAMRVNSRVGAFLSGGLDSSTVAGYAAERMPGLPTVSMGFDATGYDEMEYARIAARHFRTRPLEYYVTPADITGTLPLIAAAFSEPFGNSSAAAAYHCARIAREEGLELLLAGDGGDELFGGNERYAKQMLFERYQRIPAKMRQRLLEPAVATASNVTTAFPVGKINSYVMQANIPLPDRLQHYNFLNRHAPEDVFESCILDNADRAAPLRQLRSEYAAPIADSAIDRMLFMDWKFTLHDNDLVKVNTMCALAGVGVAYPMLDPALVNFSLRMPPNWKVRRGELRWLYRRAMKGFLPDEILRKRKHGFGLPFGVWMRTHQGLREMATDCLESLGTRGFFRRTFIRDALRLHRDGHASFYGELIWILTILELWLRHHAPDARA